VFAAVYTLAVSKRCVCQPQGREPALRAASFNHWSRVTGSSPSAAANFSTTA